MYVHKYICMSNHVPVNTAFLSFPICGNFSYLPEFLLYKTLFVRILCLDICISSDSCSQHLWIVWVCISVTKWNTTYTSIYILTKGGLTQWVSEWICLTLPLPTLVMSKQCFFLKQPTNNTQPLYTHICTYKEPLASSVRWRVLYRRVLKIRNFTWKCWNNQRRWHATLALAHSIIHIYEYIHTWLCILMF